MLALRLVLDTNVLVSAALKPDGLQRTVLLLALATRAHLVRPVRRLAIAADPDDNIFLECADSARADYLITGNQRHFPRFWKQTKVITSREFLDLVAPHLLS